MANAGDAGGKPAAAACSGSVLGRLLRHCLAPGGPTRLVSQGTAERAGATKGGGRDEGGGEGEGGGR